MLRKLGSGRTHLSDRKLNWNISFVTTTQTSKVSNFISSFVRWCRERKVLVISYHRKNFHFQLFFSLSHQLSIHRVLGKRSALHIGEECLSIYGVSYMFPKDVVYTERLNDAILRMQAYGISNKMRSEMEWDLQRKSKKALLKSQGIKTFKVTDSEERGLTLADTVSIQRSRSKMKILFSISCRKECFCSWASDM